MHMNFKCASGCEFTVEQKRNTGRLAEKFANKNRRMMTLLDNIEFRLEREKWMQYDVEKLKENEALLKRKMTEISSRQYSEESRSERKQVCKELESLTDLIRHGGKSAILGDYCYDFNIKKGIITLYYDNLIKEAARLSRYFPNDDTLGLLTGYVLVHEMFHAYYDMKHNAKIVEVEEAMAEYGSLVFLNSSHEDDIFKIALQEVSEHRFSGTWTSVYGFGAYLFNNHSSHYDLIEAYSQNNNSIVTFSKTVIEFVAGFDSGYPWNDEEHYCHLLKVIVSGKVLCDCGNISDSKDICTSCGRLLKPSGIYYCDMNNHWNKWRQGIVAGTCLQEVDLSDMGISRLELHGVIIKSLKCSHNKLKTLDLSDVKGLVEVDCSCNDILSLNIDGCNTLENLTCYYNDMYILDLTHAPSLKKLDCSYCYNLTALNVDKNVHLIELCCDGGSNFMEIKALDLSRNLELEILRCNFGILEYLDLTNNLNLKILDCSSNLLNHLDLHSNKDLRELNCEFNENLSELNVTGNLLLETLYCNSCNLRSLDLYTNVALTSLDCSDNPLESLDLSACKSLMDLYCSENHLTYLKFSAEMLLNKCPDAVWPNLNTTVHLTSKLPINDK